MSLINKASLIITPNAVKEGKLYSVVPNTPLGDMTVVRATTATRVNSAGLIEVVPRNLFTYSNTFSNPIDWGGFNQLSLTANAGISPDGNNNAFLFTKNTSSIYGWKSQNNTSFYLGVTYTFSAFVKKGTVGNTAIIRVAGGAFPPAIVFEFNFDTETITNGGSFTKLENGWYRISGQRTATSTGSGDFQIGVISALATGLNNVLIYGAQLEAGSTATEYFPTTTRLNIPRIDYTNGSCPSLLVEPQRTNLLLRSEEFNDAAWIKTNATVTSNSTISPSGTLTADTINISVQDVERVIQRVLVGTSIAGVTYTASVWVKGQGSNVGKQVRFRVKRNSGGALSDAILNYTLTSNWTRLSISFTGVTDNTGVAYSFDGATNYADSFDVWGAQLEAGSYATSYIPTVASTVTRNADVISKTGISILIGQTEGTIFLDFELLPNNINSSYVFALNDGTNINMIRSEIFILSPTILQFRTGVNTLGVGQGDFFTTITQLRNKMAISYSLNNVKIFINGTLVATDTSVTIPTMNTFNIGNRTLDNIIGSSYKQAILFKTQLSNAECIALTTL
jgi:hypothetical protein